MNCLEFNNRLQQQLDTHQSPDDDPNVLEHIAACAVCRRAWDDMRLLSDALMEWCDIPEVDLADAVVARHVAELPVAEHPIPVSLSPFRRQVSRELSRFSESISRSGLFPRDPALHRPRLALLGLAGTVAALLLLSVWQVTVESPRHLAATSPLPISESEILPAGDPMMVALVRSAGSAYFNFAHEAALQVEDAASLVWPEPATDPLREAPPAPSETPSPWVQDLNPGLAPMRKEFRSAFDFLLRTPDNHSARNDTRSTDLSDSPHV